MTQCIRWELYLHNNRLVTLNLLIPSCSFLIKDKQNFKRWPAGSRKRDEDRKHLDHVAQGAVGRRQPAVK